MDSTVCCSYLVALSLQEEQDQATRGPQTHTYPGGPAPTQPLPVQGPPQQSAQTNQEWSEYVNTKKQIFNL